MMAAALGAPVAVMETAGEGGAWGIALLAAYLLHKSEGQTLGDYLSGRVFAGSAGSRMEPVQEDVEGFERYMEAFQAGLDAERRAGELL